MAHEFTEYLGVVGAAHGIDGAFSLVDGAGTPVDLTPGTIVGVGYSRDFLRPFTVESMSGLHPHLRLHLREIPSRDAVESIADMAVYAPASALRSSARERYRIGDLEGCTVRTEDGADIGVVTDVWLLPANDVWVVTTATGIEIPLPVIDDVILMVNIEEKSILVHLLDGLMDVTTSTDEDSDA
jgi:16S rRNA processing protein RimM